MMPQLLKKRNRSMREYNNSAWGFGLWHFSCLPTDVNTSDCCLSHTTLILFMKCSDILVFPFCFLKVSHLAYVLGQAKMVKYSVSELKLLLYPWHTLYILFCRVVAYLDYQKRPSVGTFACFLIQITEYVVVDETVDLLRGGRCRSVGHSS